MQSSKPELWVIRMLKELVEYSNNLKEEMMVTLSEVNENLQGTNSEGKEAFPSTIWNIRRK